MKKLKVCTTWLKRTRTLTDSEKGRLFTAMLQYAIDGTAPDLGGREALLWDEAQEQIDQQRSSYERQQAPNVTRRDEALRRRDGGVTPHDAHEEKASPLSPPIPPSNTPLKERKKTIPKGIAKERPLDAALTEFKAMRNRMRKPMTAYAVELLVQKLQKLAPDEAGQVAILKQSIENGWTGVYPVKQETDRARKNNTLLNYDEKGRSHASVKEIELDLEEL